MKAPATFLFTFLFPAVSFACSCMAPPEARQAVKAADQVFVGKVLSVTPVDDDMMHVVRLEVSVVYKGSRRNQVVELRTASQSAACGYAFEVGGSYVVYAGRYEDGLHTNICSRTTHDVAAETAALDKVKRGRKPCTKA